MLLPTAVASGGQTGADQAGLQAAAQFGIPTGGCMPQRFLTLDGPRPELAEEFGLREHASAAYPPRTAVNVRQADGTIRFAASFNSLGEKCTRKCLRMHRKPFIDVDMTDPRPTADVVAWLRDNQIHVLNIAGNPEPKTATVKARAAVTRDAPNASRATRSGPILPRNLSERPNRRFARS